MTVLDTHAHAWDLSRLNYDWLASAPPLNKTFLPIDRDPVLGETVRSIFVQADPNEGALAELNWVLTADWPDLVGVVVGANLGDSKLSAHLEKLADYPKVVGVRHNLQSLPESVFLDRQFNAGFAALAAADYTFDACVHRSQLGLLGELVERHPRVRVVLDHFGKPNIDLGLDSVEGRDWAAAIRRLAELPNLYLKVSGLSSAASTRVLFEANVDPFIDLAVSVFGLHRSMVGSDWPLARELGAGESFADWLSRVRQVTGVDGAEWAQLASGSGTSFYRPPGC